MEEHPFHLAPDDLLIKMLAGESSDAESQQAMDWIQASDENREYFESLKKTWNSIGELRGEELEQVDKAWIKFEGRTTKRIRPIWPQIMRLAAVLLVGIATAFAVYWFVGNASNIPLKEIVNSSSTPIKHELADGSRIFLKPQAKISFPEVFSDTERQISLEGEAFFEVMEDSTRPFFVQSAQTEIRVLGTSFLVKSHLGEGKTEVLVSSGRVSFAAKEASLEPLILLKGQGAIYTHQSRKLSQLDTLDENQAAWATARFKFSKMPMEEVASILAQAFEVDISFANDSPKSCELIAEFEGEKLEDIFRILESTFPISIQKEGGQYTISGKGCE